MSKYSNKFKLEVIKYYLNQHVGYKITAQHFGIPAFDTVKKWVKKYEKNGINGLLKNQRTSYSGEYKQNVIEYMHANHLSCQETAYHFNLGNTNIVVRWERIYYEKGPQALYEEQRGRRKKMSSNPKKRKLDKQVEEDLIAENQRLRMENEYLKKLNALVQERIKQENKKK